MMYCDKCREERNWPESMARSLGPCECCGEKALCFDRKSSTLPLPDDPAKVYYCEDCRILMEWPKVDWTKHVEHHCTLCGKKGRVYRKKASELPIPDERRLQVMNDKDLPGEWSACMQYAAVLQREIDMDLEAVMLKREHGKRLTRYMRLLNRLYYK